MMCVAFPIQYTTVTDMHMQYTANLFHTINVPDAVTLGGAYDGGGASPVNLQVHDLL